MMEIRYSEKFIIKISWTMGKSGDCELEKFIGLHLWWLCCHRILSYKEEKWMGLDLVEHKYKAACYLVYKHC